MSSAGLHGPLFTLLLSQQGALPLPISPLLSLFQSPPLHHSLLKGLFSPHMTDSLLHQLPSIYSRQRETCVERERKRIEIYDFPTRAMPLIYISFWISQIYEYTIVFSIPICTITLFNLINI